MTASQHSYSPLGGSAGWVWCGLCRRWRKGGLLCALVALVAFCLLTLYCSAPTLSRAHSQSQQFVCYPMSFDWGKLIQMPRFEQMNFGIGSFVGNMMGNKVSNELKPREIEQVHAEMTEGQNIIFEHKTQQFNSTNNEKGESKHSPPLENQYKISNSKTVQTNYPQTNNPQKSYKNRSDGIENNPNKIVLSKPKTKLGDLRKKIEMLNQEQIVMNKDKFGPLTNDSVVIVIQTHKRVEYFRELINSLEKNKFISETLIVVSHGSYSSEMNDVVKKIEFTKVLQIFFPFTLETYPDSFPGTSPEDCPRDFTKEQSKKNNCTWSPRNSMAQQVKHHWWWKANFVFDHLQITRNFNGLVFFLEEDHYVFPDLLHMLKLMKAIAPKVCQDCNIFGLGLNPGFGVNYKGFSDKLKVVQWNNMGFAFDRKFWRGLSSEKCANMFCEYDDNNWDFTLAYLSHQCLPQELKPLNVLSARVFHIGDCGVHFHGKNCSALEALKSTKHLEAEALPYLFPPAVQVTYTYYNQMRVDGRNGGWKDPRDVALCKKFASTHPDNNLLQTN